MSKKYTFSITNLLMIVGILIFVTSVFPQNVFQKDKSIGGQEHELNIYGVQIGMDIPTALQAVFVSANREPGQEKPDALRKEGKDKKDIRVLYKDLELGELQIVFAQGKVVKQISLKYKNPPITDDLKLAYSSSIGNNNSTIFSTSASQTGGGTAGIIDGTTSIEEFGSTKSKSIDDFSARKVGNIDRGQGDLLDGTRYDDRYIIGFTDNQRLQRMWWRNEKTEDGYKIQLAFLGKKITDSGAKFVPSVVQKIISVDPKDEEIFLKAMFK